jgi:hypothetical protein
VRPGATPSIPPQGRLSPDRVEQQARTLLEDLKNLATAQNLLRAAEAAGPASTGRLSIAARRIPSAAGPGADPRRSCSTEPRSVPADAGEPVDSVKVPAFAHCDGIALMVENQGERTMDVAFVFVSGTGEMEPLLGRAQGQPRWCVSVPAGKPYALPYIPRFANWDTRAGKPSTIGTEHIVIVGVERSDQNAQENPLCDLKSAVTRSVAPPAGYRGAGSILYRIARDSASAGRTRSVATADIFAQETPADPTVAMRVIPVHVVAPRS